MLLSICLNNAITLEKMIAMVKAQWRHSEYLEITLDH